MLFRVLDGSFRLRISASRVARIAWARCWFLLRELLRSRSWFRSGGLPEGRYVVVQSVGAKDGSTACCNHEHSDYRNKFRRGESVFSSVTLCSDRYSSSSDFFALFVFILYFWIETLGSSHSSLG